MVTKDLFTELVGLRMSHANIHVVYYCLGVKRHGVNCYIPVVYLVNVSSGLDMCKC